MGLLSRFGFTKSKPSKRQVPGRRKELRHEHLEGREMLTLLGIDPGFPLIAYNSTGVVQYDSATQAFDLTATPLAFKASAAADLAIIEAPASLALHIRVDNAGQLVVGVLGDDLVVTGTINDGIINEMGVLLTGEIIDFGFADSGATDAYDFRFAVTGGALASLFAGKDIGMTTTSEQSTFAGVFTAPFTGGAKGNIGTTDQTTGEISGHKFKDQKGDGPTPDDTPLGGVTIQLFRDSNNNGTLDPADGGPVATTATAPGTGAYSFTNLQPGTYFVAEVVPAGSQQTFPASDYYTVGVTSGSNTTDLDFGNKQVKNPCDPKEPCKPNPCKPDPCAANPCKPNPCDTNPCKVPNPCDPKNPGAPKPNLCDTKPSKPNPCATNPSKPNPCETKVPSKPNLCDTKSPAPSKPNLCDTTSSGGKPVACGPTFPGPTGPQFDYTPQGPKGPQYPTPKGCTIGSNGSSKSTFK